MLTAYKSGAEQEAEIVTRYEAGAEVEAEGVYAYKSGAEEEVWCAIKYMKQLASTLRYADAGYWTGSFREDKGWGISCERNDGGYVTYYLEGDFTRPSISMECDGWCNYESSTGADRYASAGSVEIYTRTKSGTENYTTAFSSVNTGEDGGTLSYSNTLTGEYDRIGYRIDLASWSGAEDSDWVDYNICIWNFLIDGKQCLPSEDCVID